MAYKTWAFTASIGSTNTNENHVDYINDGSVVGSEDYILSGQSGTIDLVLKVNGTQNQTNWKACATVEMVLMSAPAAYPRLSKYQQKRVVAEKITTRNATDGGGSCTLTAENASVLHAGNNLYIGAVGYDSTGKVVRTTNMQYACTIEQGASVEELTDGAQTSITALDALKEQVTNKLDTSGYADHLAEIPVVNAAGNLKVRPVEFAIDSNDNFVLRGTESQVIATIPKSQLGGTVSSQEIEAIKQDVTGVKKELEDTNNKIFEYTAASPNVYDASQAETGKRIKSDGTIVSSINQILSDFIMIPSGSKLVFTRGDTRQASTYRTTQLFATVMLWNVNKNPITSSYLTSVSEIQNETGSNCYCRFSFSSKTEYINQMAEIMPVFSPSTDALGLTQYYDYYPANCGEKVKKTAVETDSIFDETSDNPASGKAIADAIKSPLRNKKIMFYGDSFTYDYDGAQNRYHTYIKARCGCETVIHGLIGSNITYKSDSSVLSMSDTKRLNELSEDVDMIVVFGGINDSRQIITSPNNYKIGTFGDVWDNESNTNTFYASLKHILDVLIARYPAKVIVGILPPVLNPNADRFGGYNQVCEAEIEVYKNYGIPYMDMRSKSTISNLNAHIALYNRNTTDVHWNNAGHERASYPIQIFLEQYMH